MADFARSRSGTRRWTTSRSLLSNRSNRSNLSRQGLEAEDYSPDPSVEDEILVEGAEDDDLPVHDNLNSNHNIVEVVF